MEGERKNRQELRDEVAALEERMATAERALPERRRLVAEASKDARRAAKSSAAKDGAPYRDNGCLSAVVTTMTTMALIAIVAKLGDCIGAVTSDPYRGRVVGSVVNAVEGGPPIATICELQVAATGPKQCDVLVRCGERVFVEGAFACAQGPVERPCFHEGDPAVCVSQSVTAAGKGFHYEQASMRFTVSIEGGEFEVLGHRWGEHEGELP
jgi:hypothetical protein